MWLNQYDNDEWWSEVIKVLLLILHVCVYFIGFCIVGRLRILGLLDVVHHLSQKGVTVVLVLGHQHLQHEPEASLDKAHDWITHASYVGHQIGRLICSLLDVHIIICKANLLFDVFELVIFLWLREVWVMGQQVDHVRNNVLRQERDEFFWRWRKNDALRYWEYAVCFVVQVGFETPGLMKRSQNLRHVHFKIN